MRICVIALGTRGDVQPCVALAGGLRRAGHQVRVAADPTFQSIVTRHHLEFVPVRANAQAFFQTDLARSLLEKKTTLSTWRTVARNIGPTIQRRFEDCWQACQGSDAIVVSPIGVAVGYSIAQKLGCPLVRVVLAPVIWPGSEEKRLARWIHGAFKHGIWNIFRSATNRARRDVLDLAPLGRINPLGTLERSGWPVLCAYSPEVFPLSAHASAGTQVTGYWFLDDDDPAWRPSAALERFMSAGPRPVYVGFGSMTDRAPEETTKMVVDALAAAGQRGILATGWGGLAPIDAEHVCVVEDAPHEWLFDRVSAVVHHGGAGTTAAGLRAGLPTFVVPFGIPDQPIWGRRVHEMGAGPAPIPRRLLTSSILTEQIRSLTGNAAYRSRAEAIGRIIRAEDGIGRAVEILRGALPDGHRAENRY